MRKVFVEKTIDGEFYNQNCFIACDGFKLRGYEVVFFNFEQLAAVQLEITKDTPVIGTIRSAKMGFKLVGCEAPPNVDIPEGLEWAAKRKCWTTTIGEVRNLKDVPIFIKPLVQQKVFTGHTVKNFADLIKTSYLDDEFQVMAQEVIKIDSEWRFYVLEEKIVGCGSYNGNPTIFPNTEFVNKVLSGYKNIPVACSIDIGVMNSGDSVLIEVNDGYSLGNYGVPSLIYSKMMEKRWDEIVSSF